MSSFTSDYRPKLKRGTKIEDVYPTLHQVSSTMALKLLLQESMHSRGALIACRFPGQCPTTKSSPPSTLLRNYHFEEEIDTAKATASPARNKENPDHEDNSPDKDGGASTISSWDHNILTPRNLEDKFNAGVALEVQTFDSEKALVDP